jgi:hypothetical protein
MLAADRGRADAFDLGADPDSGAISPSDVGRLRNTVGYVPQIWTEARTQLRSTSDLLDALVGKNHSVILAYGRFLRMYERMQTRLESELDYAHGRRLGPALMNFHAQLAWRNWLVTQLDSSERSHVNPHDFCQCLSMLESQNNLMWIPTVTNVPALLALCASPRGGDPSPVSNLAIPSVPPLRATAAPAVVGTAPARRDAAPPSSQPHPRS